MRVSDSCKWVSGRCRCQFFGGYGFLDLRGVRLMFIEWSFDGGVVEGDGGHSCCLAWED